MRALLDVNVLIALLDAGHTHHQIASTWLESQIKHGWASCPLTQNGCLRIMAQPSYPQAVSASSVAQRLTQATGHLAHRFIPNDYSLLDTDVIDWSKILGHRQITDAYLLGLAVKHGCRFVTFDGRIDPKIVSKGTTHHLLIL